MRLLPDYAGPIPSFIPSEWLPGPEGALTGRDSATPASAAP